MIEMVLCHANKLRVSRIGRLGHQRLVETLRGKTQYRLPEFVIELFEHANGITPILRTRLRDRWPALRLCEWPGVSTHPPQNQAVVGGQMENQLPDTVSASDRVRRCLDRRDVFKDFKYGRAVPRVTLKCPLHLLFEPSQLSLHIGPARSSSGHRP